MLAAQEKMLQKMLTTFNRLDANDQLLHSHSQSITKIEVQVGQIATGRDDRDCDNARTT